MDMDALRDRANQFQFIEEPKPFSVKRMLALGLDEPIILKMKRFMEDERRRYRRLKKADGLYAAEIGNKALYLR